VADSLEAQLQPVNICRHRRLLRQGAILAYQYAHASERKLTSPSGDLDAIKGLRTGKALGLTGIPNRALRHVPKRTIIFLAIVFKRCPPPAVGYIPPVWKHARVVSILSWERAPCTAFFLQIRRTQYTREPE
jgi:hypothetical protein